LAIDRLHRSARITRHSPTLDVERQERGGYAARAESRVWFTISHGILNEIYAPRLDTACIRISDFIVTANNYFRKKSATPIIRSR